MGGCAVSVMSTVNAMKVVENPAATKARATQQATALSAFTARNESSIYREPTTADWTLEDLYRNTYGASHGQLAVKLREAVEQYGDRNAMAYRPIEKIEKAEIDEGGKKRPWEFIHLQETQYLTFREMWSMMMAFGHGLVQAGFGSKSVIGLYEETRYEWLVSLYGLWSQGMTGVTVYANLGEDALAYALKEAEVDALVINGKAVAGFVSTCAKHGIKCPTLIVVDAIPAGVEVSAAPVLPFVDVVAKGRGQRDPILGTDAEETALIMYTSGTTGDPKGVVMTHGNVYAAVLGLESRLCEVLPDSADNTFIAYLPLAHIMEFCSENVVLCRGNCVCYGNPRTLTDTSAKPHGDLKEFKPTFLTGVPRVFDTIRKAVEAKLPPPGDLKRRVFERAYQERRDALEQGRDTPYWNAKVFSKFTDLLGGRCRAIVSGGAPLSGPTLEFLAVCFVCSVHQGYGLTETCTSGCIQRYYDLQKENVGGPVYTAEIKLRDAAEWKHTDPEPRGEILIRGPAVAKGYYKQPEKTKEAFLEDGFFCTGDVGQITKDGTLKIVGRVKALAKNALGEYIAMEQLETIYVLDDLALPNGICVLVHPHKAYIAALVLTDEKKALAFAEKNGIAGGYPEVLADKVFQQKAAASLAATAKAQGRKPFECVKYVRVLADEWTPENGVLTAAMKLKRRVIDEKYADTIQALFAA